VIKKILFVVASVVLPLSAQVTDEWEAAEPEVTGVDSVQTGNQQPQEQMQSQTGETGVDLNAPVADQPAPPAKQKSVAVQDGGYSPEAATAVVIPGGVLFGEFAKEDGPFLIENSIIVPSGQTLEFKPGSVIYMGGKYSTITVFGQIIAKGTAAEPILFKSANKDPKPWDWDRIYCRSRNRSLFEFCFIKNSNYGIFVENGSVGINNCTFEQNSLHGCVVKNSDVTLSNSLFDKGHVLALFCQAGANVYADSLVIRNNITGIAFEDQSYFKMERGVIRGNTNGVALRKGASVNFVAADISRNRIGVVSEEDINKRVREMVYENNLDVKIVTSQEMVSVLKPPEEVKSIALPATKTDIQMSANFKPGFSALKAPREATTSFIGNVSLGFKYFAPESHRHPYDSVVAGITENIGATDTTYDTSYSNARYYQNKYPGEKSSPFQPEFIIFAQGKRGLLDVNFNTDMIVNDWYEYNVKANMFTLSTNYADQHFILGDYYENISETSISGRKMRGIRYSGEFLPMGRGTKRMEFKLAAGETERKKDLGDHEVELFSDTVDTGASIRQQLTYVANLAFKPVHNVTVSARGLISHDQNENPLFSQTIEDTAVPNPVSASTGCLDANIQLFDGKMEINAELDMGAHDTVDTNDWNEIAWYKPRIPNALKRVFGVIRPDSNNYAFLLDVQGAIKEYDVSASYMEVAQHYFSAGNPYLEPDRRLVTFGADRQFTENFIALLGYEYEQTSVSYNSDDNKNESSTFYNTISGAAEYSFGEEKPGFAADYEMKFQHKSDDGSVYVIDSTGDTVPVLQAYTFNEIDHTAGIEYKQRFSNGIDYSIKYMVRRKNDFSEYNDVYAQDKEDSWENGVRARLNFRIKQLLRNKISLKVKYKTEVEDDMNRFDIKITDDMRITVIPRKLTLTLKGEYRNQLERADDLPSDGIRLNQKTIQIEAKYAITSKLAATAMGKYEDYYDEAESSSENYSIKVGGLLLTYLF